MATVSNFEIPIYAKSKWIAPLDDFIAKDPTFDQGDILKPMAASLTADDGKVYGEPLPVAVAVWARDYAAELRARLAWLDTFVTEPTCPGGC